MIQIFESIQSKNLFNDKKSIKSYLKIAPKKEIINWYDLPNNSKLLLNPFPKDLKRRGRFVTVRRIKDEFGNDSSVSKYVKGIKRSMTGSEYLKISFPITLNNKIFSCLYALMISEGYFKKEFSIHVPEEFFHEYFKYCISSLLSKDFSNVINVKLRNGIKKSRAPGITRYLMPINSVIPFFILNNKEFSKEYLKVAFEAEGSPIFDNKYKRYIKLSRYINVSKYVEKENFPLEKRIYLNELINKYKLFYNLIKDKPPITLLGEHIILKKHFGINNTIRLEAIRHNKTSNGKGKITARWVLLIYADDINKFIDNIGFISEKKKNVCKEMLKVKKRRPQFFSLEIIKKIQKNKLFYLKDFVREMRKIGYSCPICYISRYCKKGLIEKINRGCYKIIS